MHHLTVQRNIASRRLFRLLLALAATAALGLAMWSHVSTVVVPALCQYVTG